MKNKLIITISLLFLILINESYANDLKQFYQCENYHSINIEKIATGHDVVAVTLNGVNSRFIIDTGAKATVIDNKLLSKYKIDRRTVIEKEEAAGAAGKILIYKYPLDSLRINSYNIQIPTIYSTDLSQVINGLGFTTGMWVDGIIGQDVLLAHSGIIDSFNKQLLIQPDSTTLNNCEKKSILRNIFENRGYQAIALNVLNTNLATFTVSINDEQGDFILDSGAGSGILNQDSLSKFHLSEKDFISSRQSTGAGGAITLQIINLDSIKINSLNYDIATINSLDLSAVVKELKTRSKALIHGVIGQDLLQKYQAIISFHDNTLYLKPDEL
jgi:predicted aspartyl protease